MRNWISVTALFLAGWFSATAALAQPAKPARTVQDDLGMFSTEAKAKANAEIARIKQAHHKDLMIEAVVAPNPPKGLDVNDKAAVNRYIDQWADTKFKNEQIDGVLVVFVEKGALKKIRVRVGPKTASMGLFTKNNADELLQRIQEKMKSGDKDSALMTATSYVADTMRHHAQPAARGSNAPAPTPGGEQRAEPTPIMTWVLIGLGVLLVFWLISAIIRGFSSMGGGGGGGYGPGYGYGGGGGGGGGGFMNGFLGGLFGAAAGMWAYNHFFGGGGPSAYAGGPASSGYPSNEPTDVGAGDPIGAGGDYGDVDKGAIEAPDDAGGGDWGGGDAGGGGDWGGGGGDFGGGGGDWGGGGGGGDW
jgi:uncharacterized protein